MSEKISEPGSGPGSAADDLARRFFALWTEYLAALVTDPKMTEQLGRWLAFGAGALQNPAPGNAPPGSAPGSAPHAATAAGASGERDGVVAELARRVDELARRVAALERPGEHGEELPGERGTRPAGGARRGNRAARS
jgi:hypothetical protein